jgi:hypothetical protein
MRALPWLLFVLSLTTAVCAENRIQAAPPDKGASPDKGQNKLADSDEAIDPTTLFPLATRNGIHIRAETSTSPDKMIVRHNFIPSFAVGYRKLKKVAAHPEEATAIQLGVAADMTFRAGNLQDAAFLFYAARLRAYQDIEKYPPKDLAGTNWFLSVVLDGVKIDLLRSLYLQPKVLAEVVKRIEALDLKEPAGYDPGWSYERHKAPADLFAKNKALLLDDLKPTSELLLLPAYFQAFCVLRECNDLSQEQQQTPAITERRTKATDTMKRLEKEKNLHGLIFQIESQPVD